MCVFFRDRYTLGQIFFTVSSFNSNFSTRGKDTNYFQVLNVYFTLYIRILYIEFYKLAVMSYEYSENTTSPFNFLCGTSFHAYRSFLSGSQYILFVCLNGCLSNIILELKYLFVVEKGDGGVSLIFPFFTVQRYTFLSV